jgi:hypothetical protein
MLQAVPAPPAELAIIAKDLAPTSRQRRSVEQVVLDIVGDDGGPLLSHGQSEAEQRSFDATCRKLFRFLTDPAISGARAQSAPAATNRPSH